MSKETTAHYCIVVKPESGALALVRRGDEFHLPVVHLPNPCWLPRQVAELNDALMETFGLNCTTLRWLENADDFNLVAMEWHPGAQSPETDVEWFDQGHDALRLPPDEQDMLRVWRQSSTRELVPWEQLGWMRQVVISLIGVFDGMHNPRVTHLAQFKAGWGMSTLMLIETEQSDYFFKAGVRQGAEEWQITRYLHRRFPRYVREPFMVDENHGWMISKRVDHLGFPPGDLESLGDAFRAYAEIQLGSDDFLRSEAANELPVRDEHWLKAHLNRLFSESACPAEFRPILAELSARERGALREKWSLGVNQLAESRLPLTFGQEDLHLSNILNTNSGPVFIDWADCAQSHPFFGIHRAFDLWGVDDAEISRREMEAVKRAYLDEFSHLAPHEILEAEFDLTGTLSLLYQAFRCQEISSAQDPDSPWGKHCFVRAARYMNRAIESNVSASAAATAKN